MPSKSSVFVKWTKINCVLVTGKQNRKTIDHLPKKGNKQDIQETE